MQNAALATATRPAKPTVVDRLSAVAQRWWHSHQQKRRLRATVRILQGLDDRTLKDIGLHRSEIESVVATRCVDRRLQYVDFAGVNPCD